MEAGKKILKSRVCMTVIAAVLVIALILVIVVAAGNGSDEETAYRETTVQKGSLVVGITEDGSVEVGTVDQTFELDLSALQRADTDSSQSTSGGSRESGQGGQNGGPDMMQEIFNQFDQMFSLVGGGNADSADTVGELEVSQVCVSVGQQVAAGDVLYLLEEDSVADIREELQTNVEKAEADLNAVYAEQTLSRQTAQYTYDSSVAYGTYADTEYRTTLTSLENAVTEKEKQLERARKLQASCQEQLEQAETDYEEAVAVLENCEWSRDNTDKWESTYNYVTYFQMAQTAQSNVDTLEQKKEQLEQNVEQAGQNVETCSRELARAERELASGRLTAEETLSLRRLAGSTAQETYDITTAYQDSSVKEQEETYADAKEKWEEFSSHIDGNAVKAKYDGVITEVSLEEGDSIHTGDTLVTLYDTEDVSMTVSLDEDDMADIAVGGKANVSFTAYPEEVFQAEVTQIADAETDSSGNVTRDVTVTLQGDVSGLYQGMTGDITFITKETREVLYVSNRAISREGKKSYVKIRDEDGQIRRQEVTTGFSDGVSVEIVEGLSEGDVVLVESKVSES